MSLKKEENCNKREVFKLQLAGKVDLVWKQISLVFVDRSWSCFGILIKAEKRFFSESMKVIEASLEKLGEIGFFSNNSGVCCPILLKF